MFSIYYVAVLNRDIDTAIAVCKNDGEQYAIDLHCPVEGELIQVYEVFSFSKDNAKKLVGKSDVSTKIREFNYKR